MNKKLLAIISLLSIIIGCAGLPDPKQKMYTACNIWISPKMHCINFKASSNFIPAGTEITVLRGFYCEYGVCFKTAFTGNKKHTLHFTSRWHPGKTTNDYNDIFFTTKDFAALTEGLTSREIKAIKQGVIIEGMSKRAVLISYGIPPEHKTPNLSSNVWIYFLNRIDQKKICFARVEYRELVDKIDALKITINEKKELKRLLLLLINNEKTIRCNKMTVDGLEPL